MLDLSGKRATAVRFLAAAVCAASLAGVTVNPGYEEMSATSWPKSSATNTQPIIATAAGPGIKSTSETISKQTAEAESFTAPCTFTLGAISIVASGASFVDEPNSLSVHLYAAKDSLKPNSGSLKPSADLGPDLFGGGHGLSFTTEGGENAILELDLTGADQVVLHANKLYVLEIWNVTSDENIFYFARSNSQQYHQGQIYATHHGDADGKEASDVVRGRVARGPRNMITALYPIGDVATTRPTSRP